MTFSYVYCHLMIDESTRRRARALALLLAAVAASASSWCGLTLLQQGREPFVSFDSLWSTALLTALAIACAWAGAVALVARTEIARPRMRVDGATRGQAFRMVVLPLATPALFTTAILAFVATWNEFMLARQLSTTATEPVTVAIARFSGPSAFEYPYASIMAAGALVTIPLIIMVLIFQRRIVSGLTAGGVKA